VTLTQITPWLQMFIVNLLRDVLQIQTSQVTDDRSLVSSGNTKHGAQMSIHRLLVRVTLVSQIKSLL
jgi:hypothetical protein